MKLTYKNPGPEYSAQSIAEFINHDESRTASIFHFLPKLGKFKGSFNKDTGKGDIVKEILETITSVYKSNEREIKDKLISYQGHWDRHEKLVNVRFSSIFQYDTNSIFNNLACNITLNPISPRYLRECVFDVFYLNSDKGSLGSALHEITHYLWFHLWNKRHNDSYKQYESPSLIWILSEAVVEQILKDEAFNMINPYHKGENAYSCFYHMMIDGTPLYDHLDTIYKNSSIDKFMDESYRFMLEHEDKIRSQLPNQGSY